MEIQSRSINITKIPPLTALHLDMKDAAEEDEDDKDNTNDNRESVSLVQGGLPVIMVMSVIL